MSDQSPPTGAAAGKLSPVEKIKAESRYLRGTIAEELAGPADGFSKDMGQLIKHHGMYQQDNRDQRASKEGKKSARQVSFMIRAKIPGGRLSSTQLLAQLDLCDELGNTTLRITDRQALQFHGVVKGDLRQLIRRVDEVQMTTLGACGDVERNVMCCPAPLRFDGIRDQLHALARRLSEHLLPRSRAYHEIWIRDPESGQQELVGGQAEAEESEPLYGRTYLPRKFKTAIGLPEDNCVDIHANDLGFLTIHQAGRILGFNVLVGGGMGVTPSNKNTFPALSRPIAFITPEEVVDMAEAVIRVYRDFGDRGDRKRARLKYLIADWGLERFRQKVEEYYGKPLAAARPVLVHGFDDHLGWNAQGDGRWFYGLNVENGRILDNERMQLKSALREICGRLAPGISLTSHQSILFTDLPQDARPVLEEILRRHGIKRSEDISNVRRWSMACVALPTCPLAVTESERVLPSLMDELEQELSRLGLADERFTTRMTGCPNGCARPYNADVGLVGKTAGKYTLYLGGRLLGDRLAFIYKELVPLEEVVATLRPVLVAFKAQRQEGETFGDFCHRLGREGLEATTADAMHPV